MIIETVNRFDKNYFSEFQNKYTKLDYIEIIICFVLILEIENNEIAVFFNTIQQKEVETRKKIGVQPRGNIKLFLENDFKPLFLHNNLSYI